MAERKRRWIPIAFGIAFVLVCLIIGAIIVVASLFRESVDTRESSADEATVAFDEVRRRFGGRAPLIEYRDGEPHRIATIEQPSTVALQHLKIWSGIPTTPISPASRCRSGCCA